MAEKPKTNGIPIMVPDGQVYMVPPDQIAEAHLHRGRLALRVEAPGGAQHWVPVDQAVEAQAHGWRFVQNDGKEYASGTEPVITGVNAAGQPMWGSGPKYLGRDASGMPLYDRSNEPAGPVSRFLSSAGSAIGGAIKGIPAMFDPRANEFEQTHPAWNTPLAAAGGPVTRLLEPQVEMGEQAMEEARAALAGGPDARAHGLEAVRHGVGAAVPMLGPWIVGTEDQMVRQAASGDIAGALGTAAGNLAVAAAPEAGEGALGAFRKAARGRLAEMQAPRAMLDKPIAPGEPSPMERWRAAHGMGVNLDRAQATNAPVLRIAKTATEKSLTGNPQFEANNAANVQALHSHAADILDRAHPEAMDRRTFGERVQGALQAHRDALADVPGQAAAADTLLNGIHPEKMTRSQFGAAAKAALEEHLATVRDAENEIYAGLDHRIGYNPPNVQQIRQSARGIYDANKRFYDEHPEALSGGDARAWKWIKDLAGVDKDGKLAPINDPTGLRNWSDLQTARSHLLDMTRGKDVVGARPTAWIKQLTGKIDETMTDAEHTPGMTKKDVADFRSANEMHRGLKETYDNNQSPFYWLLRDDPSAVADRINGLSPENFQRLQSSMNEINRGDVVAQARRQFAERLMDPTGSGTPDLAGLPKRWKSADKPTVEGILQPDHMVALGDLADKAAQQTVYDKPGSQLKQVVDAPDGTTAAQKIFNDSGKLLLTPEEVATMEQADSSLVPMLRRQAIERQFDPAGNGTVDLRNFASRWNRAQKEPLQGVLTPDQIKDLTDLAGVSKTVNLPSNPSGTASVLQPASEAGQVLRAGTNLGASTVGAATGAAVGGPLGAAAGTALGAAADIVGKGLVARRLLDPDATAAVMEHTPPMPVTTAIKNAAAETVKNLPQSALKAAPAAAQQATQKPEDREGVSTPPPGGPAPGRSGGVANLQDPSGNVIYRPGQAPEGATHEVLHPDGKTLLGHVVNGEYVPLETTDSAQ
jgi:hypothetical protein